MGRPGGKVRWADQVIRPGGKVKYIRQVGRHCLRQVDR